MIGTPVGLAAPAPYDARDGVIWLDGVATPWPAATLHVLSHGLHYAGCVFEGARCYGGRIFLQSAHSRRLHDSARMLGFAIPYDVPALDEAAAAVVAGNGVEDGYVRTVAWRGAQEMGVGGRRAGVHVAVCAWPIPSRPPNAPGLKLAVSRWARPSPATAPTAAKAAGLYMISSLAKLEAEDEGCDDALMFDWRGFLAEATSSNLFLVIEGRLHTPRPEGFLDGLTRRVVMDLARADGVEVVERTIAPGELDRASEVFLTGTASEVTPVSAVGSRRYPPGPLTQRLAAAYTRLTRATGEAAAPLSSAPCEG